MSMWKLKKKKRQGSICMFACVCICVCAVCSCVETRNWLHRSSSIALHFIILLQGFSLNIEDAELTRPVVIKPLESSSLHPLGLGLQVHITVQITGAGYRCGYRCVLQCRFQVRVAGVSCMYGFQVRATGAGYQFFIWKLGIQAQVFMFVQKTHCPCSHLHSPKFHF